MSVGPVGGEVTTVELVEVGGRTGMLTFVAEGLALGFEAGAQGPQSWTDFTTPEPMRLEHFACPGRVTSVGGHVIYGATYSWVTFYPAAQKTVKIASSGHGWGFGGRPLDHRRHLEAALHRLTALDAGDGCSHQERRPPRVLQQVRRPPTCVRAVSGRARMF